MQHHSPKLHIMKHNFLICLKTVPLWALLFLGLFSCTNPALQGLNEEALLASTEFQAWCKLNTAVRERKYAPSAQDLFPQPMSKDEMDLTTDKYLQYLKKHKQLLEARIDKKITREELDVQTEQLISNSGLPAAVQDKIRASNPTGQEDKQRSDELDAAMNTLLQAYPEVASGGLSMAKIEELYQKCANTKN